MLAALGRGVPPLYHKVWPLPHILTSHTPPSTSPAHSHPLPPLRSPPQRRCGSHTAQRGTGDTPKTFQARLSTTRVPVSSVQYAALGADTVTDTGTGTNVIGTYTDTGVMGTGGDTGVKEGADGDTVTGADAVRAGGGADGGASGGVRGVSGGDDGGSGGVRGVTGDEQSKSGSNSLSVGYIRVAFFGERSAQDVRGAIEVTGDISSGAASG